MKAIRIISCIAAIVLLVGGASVAPVHTSAESNSKVVTIDGKKANSAPQSEYRGLGMVSGNNSSRLLLDYKDENPDKYQEILNYLFNTETGIEILR